jgi:pimeloyl-ACP methyl ester carboxylesterase
MASMTKRMVLFIHGLGGDSKATWLDFPELLRSDLDVSARYQNIESFGYATSKIGSSEPLGKIAHELELYLDQINRANTLDEIVFITHSQGGLLARRYLCDRLLKNKSDQVHLPTFRILTFATPHWGAYPKTVGDWLPNSLAQPKDLCFDSDAILSLNRDWSQIDAEDRISVRRVIASNDAIVPMFSALGANFDNDYRILSGFGHIDIVKVENLQHPSYILAKTFLLEDACSYIAHANVDKTPPTLFTVGAQPNTIEGNNRFIYTARYLPLVGRENEKTKLEKFLIEPCPENMGWMSVKGAGGVGKSRLGLELALACQNDWHAGFLNPDALEPDWARWQPNLPTLLIVDYATDNIQRLGKLLRGLCNREKANRLRRPVRVILLDRETQEENFEKAIGYGPSAIGINIRRHPDLNLESIKDPWEIIEGFFRHSEFVGPDKELVIEQLYRIDSKARPLFAMLLADAYCSGVETNFITSRGLLENILNRERAKYWEPACHAQGESLIKLENVLAVATVIGGLVHDELYSEDDQWDPDIAAPVFQTMSGYDFRTDTVQALEPDMLGECFALNRFQKISITRLNKILRWAWNNRPLQTFSFFSRVCSDFPSDSLLEINSRLLGLNEDGSAAWARWVMNLIGMTAKEDPSRAESAYSTLDQIASDNPDAYSIRYRSLMAGYNLMVMLEKDISEIIELERKSRALTLAHPKRSDFGLVHALILAYHVSRIEPEDLIDVEEYLKEIRILVSIHVDEKKIAASLSLALFHAGMKALQDLSVARIVMSELGQLMAHNPGNLEIESNFLKLTCHVIGEIGSANVPDAVMLTLGMSLRIGRHLGLMSFYVVTIAKLIQKIAHLDTVATLELVDELLFVAENCPWLDNVNVVYADTINFIITHLQKDDDFEFQRYLSEINRVLQLDVENQRLRSIYTHSIASAIFQIYLKDRRQAFLLVEEMRLNLEKY